MNTQRLLPLLVLGASLGLGCSSSSSENKPPVFDDVQAPDTAAKGASGNYEASLKVSCHDDDGNIVKARIESSGFASTDLQIPAQSSFKDAQIILQFSGNAPAGKIDYTLTITDDQGATASKALSITLQ